MALTLNVNGVDVSVDATPDTPILWVIREHLSMTGPNFGQQRWMIKGRQESFSEIKNRQSGRSVRLDISLSDQKVCRLSGHKTRLLAVSNKADIG